MTQIFRCIVSAALLPTTLLLTACDDGGDGGDQSALLETAPQVQDDMFELGRALFFDKVLSGNRDVACATCHHPTLGTDDDLALSRGVGAVGLGAARAGGGLTPRNAPALFNLHEYPTMFWDSRVEVRNGQLQTPAGNQLTAEMEATFSHGVVAAQAMFPVTSRVEMRGEGAENELAQIPDGDFQGIWSAIMTRLGQFPEYVEMFERAYPGTAFSSMTFAHAANAIAGYELRAFEQLDSPYQRFLEGDDDALSAQASRGLDEFMDAGCDNCHSGPLLSDFEHHNTGLAQFGPGVGHGVGGRDDFGREGVTGNRQDRYEFRTTPLINLSHTGPFGHAGQFATLESFIDHYRNAERALQQYDIRENVSQPELWSTVVDNRDEIADTLDRRVDGMGRFDTDAIAAFLREASSPASAMPAEAVPQRVPSGLTVD